MLYEDYNYNKNEDLNICPVCKQSFKEGESVSMINPPKGPFLLVHKNCIKLISNTGKNQSKNNDTSEKIRLRKDDKLWRYMDLGKFISMLMNKSLYFSVPDAFDDIYEGAHGELRNKQAWDNYYSSFARASIITAPDNCWHNIEKESLEENVEKLVEEISGTRKGGLYINCWHLSEYESEAMWKLYSINVSNAVAIQTTYQSLQQQLEQATIRPIQYINYSNQFVGPNDQYWYKRKSFEYEKEVRAIIHNFDNSREKGIEIKVDLTKLIKKIYISPYSPKWFQDVVVDLINRYEYKFDIHLSNMAEIPF